MGWLMSFILLLIGLFAKDSNIVIASGLFAIAGSIEALGIKRKEDK